MAFKWGVNLNHWTKSWEPILQAKNISDFPTKVALYDRYKWSYYGVPINGGHNTTGDGAHLEPHKKPTKKGGFVAKKSVGRIVRLAISTLRDPWLSPFEWWFRWPPGPMYKIDHFEHFESPGTILNWKFHPGMFGQLNSPSPIGRLCRTASCRILGGKGFIQKMMKTPQEVSGSFLNATFFNTIIPKNMFQSRKKHDKKFLL